MPKNPKESCVNCHFFVYEVLPPTGRGNPYIIHVSLDDREAARRGEYTWVEEYMTLRCNLGVWDVGYDFKKADRHEIIVDTDRKNFCFFLPFKPGMLLPAGEILERRLSEQRESSRDRKLTLWGLWIAALALGFSAIFTLIQLLTK